MDKYHFVVSDDSNDTSLVCRGCLAESGHMKNMIEWNLCEDFSKTTNVQVSTTDNLSELLCENCEENLIKCKMWITKCQESDMYLRSKAIKKRGLLSTDDVDDINNLHQNTVSCIKFDNNVVVTIVAPQKEKKILLPCPFQCVGEFTKKPDLLHHMIREHKVGSTFSIDLQYYCSISNCSYFLNSGQSKYFNARKFLNQHYNKVHKEKISCKTCKLSFPTNTDFTRHLKTCNYTFECQSCNTVYKTNEQLLVHLLRRHPSLHQQYKTERALKRKSFIASSDNKKPKIEDYMCDSPKRSFATQTLDNIRNDVTLSSWRESRDETKRDEISTQTVFEDLLSLKSNEEESIFCSETVSLSDIQTQTIPIEFGLSRSNKETITSETQSPDLSLKGTQTCLCLYDSKRVDNASTSTETQTKEDLDTESNSIETQTSFDEVDNF